ncbi:hypothetical protein HMSSN036_23050 [Paenibacillus macerans]|nr:hypothetical protein HMSSN036_23050 [Paenibacillus macerans]
MGYLQHFIHEKEVYFVVEDYKGKHWFYEGVTRVVIENIIPELAHINEYYLISKKFDWILCENHHNVLSVSGGVMVDRITKFVEANGDEIIT